MEFHPLVLLISVTLVLGVFGDDGLVSNNYCTQEAAKAGEPSRPVYKGSYTTQIAVKVVHSKIMDMVTENYDQTTNMMANELTRFGNKYLRLLDLNKKTYTSVYFGYCKTFTKHAYLKDSYMGFSERILNTGDRWKYKGNTMLRGVEVTQWDSCTTAWGGLVNYTASYFYTKDNKTPFRLEAKGIQYATAAQTSSKPYHIILDYFIYSKQKPPANAFQPPAGVSCGTNTVATPPMPPSALYKEEQADGITKTITYKRVYFDKTNMFVSESELDGPKTIIRDFNRGIKFSIDMALDSCKRSAIFSAVGTSDFAAKSGTIHMSSIKQFFLDDGKNFTYNGQQVVRGIKCDVYTKLGRSAEQYGQTVIEVFTAADGVLMMNRIGDQKPGKNVIVRVMVKGGKSKTMLKRYDFFDYRPSPSWGYGNYAMQPCFTPEDTLEFSLTVNGPPFTSWADRGELEYGLKKTICKMLGINYLRLTLYLMEFGDGMAIMSGKIYEKEKSRSLFKLYAYRVPANTKNFKTYSNSTNTPSICADYCAKTVPLPGIIGRSYCYGFTFNRESHECAFTVRYTRNIVRTSKRHYATDFYERSGYTYRAVSKIDAYLKLQTQIDQGKLSYTIKNGNVYKVNSTQRTSDLIGQNTLGSSQGDSSMKHFKIFMNAKVYERPVFVLTGYSPDACARRCLNSLTIECEAFQYDTSLRKCSLFDKFEPSFLKTTTSTPFYRRTYYDYFDLMPGSSDLASSDAIYTSTNGVNTCAKLCVRNGDFFCESFQMCGTICALNRKHYYSTPQNNQNIKIKCFLFTRKYITDYKKRVDMNALPGSNVATISDISVRKCAHICSTSPVYKCNVFEYQRTSSTCRVSTVTRSSGSLSFQKAATWDLYQRKQELSLVNIRQKPMAAAQTSAAHTSGEMGGMAFGMILLSVILTIVVVLVVLKLRSGTPLPGIVNANFSKNRLEEYVE